MENVETLQKRWHYAIADALPGALSTLLKVLVTGGYAKMRRWCNRCGQDVQMWIVGPKSFVVLRGPLGRRLVAPAWTPSGSPARLGPADPG